MQKVIFSAFFLVLGAPRNQKGGHPPNSCLYTLHQQPTGLPNASDHID